MHYAMLILLVLVVLVLANEYEMGLRRRCCGKEVIGSSCCLVVNARLDQRFEPPSPQFGTTFEASGDIMAFDLFKSSSRDMLVG